MGWCVCVANLRVEEYGGVASRKKSMIPGCMRAQGEVRRTNNDDARGIKLMNETVRCVCV